MNTKIDYQIGDILEANIDFIGGFDKMLKTMWVIVENIDALQVHGENYNLYKLVTNCDVEYNARADTYQLANGFSLNEHNNHLLLTENELNLYFIKYEFI